MNGNKNKPIKAKAKAIIPINLSGTERNIAYNGRKYHQVQYVLA